MEDFRMPITDIDLAKSDGIELVSARVWTEAYQSMGSPRLTDFRNGVTSPSAPY